MSGHTLEKIIEAVNELKAQRVEFIIMNIPLSKDKAEMLVVEYLRIHFVFIDVPPDARVNAVCGAHYEGAKQAAQLILSLQRK